MSEPVSSPVVGYRLWQVNSPFTRLLPLGFYAAEKTWVGPEAEAMCLAGVRTAEGWKHPAPTFGCSCGLYAWKTAALMFDSHPVYPISGSGAEALVSSRGMSAKPVVAGAVVAWGKITEHELGFRAQRMRVTALLESVGASRIAEHLGVPVLNAEEIEGYAQWFGAPLKQ